MLASRQACANPVVTQFGLRGYCVLRSLIEHVWGRNGLQQADQAVQRRFAIASAAAISVIITATSEARAVLATSSSRPKVRYYQGWG